MNRITRRSAVSALAALAAAAPLARPASAADKITVTVPSTNVDDCAIFIAAKKGYFAEEGLDATVQIAGGGVATPALLSGTVQGIASPASALSAILRGADLRVLLVFGTSPPYQLWGNESIRSLADLRGKRIGVQTLGDTFELATRVALLDAGIPADSVGFTPLGVGSTVGAALTNGQVQAMCTATVEVREMRAAGLLKNAHLVLDYFGKVHMPFNGLATSQKLIASQPQLVTGMVRAIVKGVRYARAFKDQAVAITAGYSTSPNMTALAADYDDMMRYLTPTLTAPPSALQPDLTVRSQLLNIPAAQLPPIDRVYDFRFVQTVNAELDKSRWRPTA